MHGYYLAPLGFQIVVERNPVLVLKNKQAIEGIITHFEVTGVEGLLTSSFVKYDGPRLDWMDTEEVNPTKFWMKGQNGYWFKNGVAKGHYGGTIFGLGIVVALDARGDISLSNPTRNLLYYCLNTITNYLIDNDYNIIDYDGKRTDFGKLNDWKYNGYSGLQLVAMLAAARTTGNLKAAVELEHLIDKNVGPALSASQGLVADLYTRIGRQNALGHFSDDIHVLESCLVYMLHAQPHEVALQESVTHVVKKYWQFLRYSRKSIATYITGSIVGVTEEELEIAKESLKQFPLRKFFISNITKEETDQVQPIPTQKINSNYWKTNYFRKATLLGDKPEYTNIEAMGQDFLSAYWMGVYFGLLSR